MAKVTGPDGRTWRVGRRWLPWRPRKRDIDDHYVDAVDAVDDVLAGLAWLVVSLVLGAVLTLVLPWLVLLVEVVLVVLVIPLVTVGRLLLRKPFTVVAYPIGPRRPGSTVTARVVGWRASGALSVQWQRDIAEGRVPQPPGTRSRTASA